MVPLKLSKVEMKWWHMYTYTINVKLDIFNKHVLHSVIWNDLLVLTDPLCVTEDKWGHATKVATDDNLRLSQTMPVGLSLYTKWILLLKLSIWHFN